MFTLVSKPYSKAKMRFDPHPVAKPMFWLSVALYLVAFALPVGSGRFGESGLVAFGYGALLCLRAPWLWVGWLANGRLLAGRHCRFEAALAAGGDS